MTRKPPKRRARRRIPRAPYLVELANAGLIPPAPREATRRYDVMRAVLELTARNGAPPSAVALAAELGMSRQCATRYLLELEAEGLLSDVPVTVRSGKWSVTERGELTLWDRQQPQRWQDVKRSNEDPERAARVAARVQEELDQNGVSSSPSPNLAGGPMVSSSSDADGEEREPLEPDAEPCSSTSEATTSVL